MNRQDIIAVLIVLITLTLIAGLLQWSVEDNRQYTNEKKQFCEEKGLLYESEPGFQGIGNCLMIDQGKRIVKTYELKKINGEFYLE